MKQLGTILLFLIFVGSSYAAHIIGGDFTYQCTAPGEYDFVLTMYRDCDGNGGQFDSVNPNGLQASITVYRGTDPDPLQTFNLNAPNIELLDPEGSNPCVEIPPNICVQKGVYRFSRNLDISNESYYVVYQRCCRNGTITNIYDPGGTGMTFQLEMTPEAQAFCNSSPSFVDFPPPLICTNNPLNFDHSATDIDGDQLVYEFCSPLSGGSVDEVAPNPEPPPPYNEVDFRLPDFTALNPVGGSPNVMIDPSTGLITGMPLLDGQYVVGVCVSEYRNGVLLSKVQRDFQFNITACDPVIDPAFQGFPNAGVDQVQINLCGSKTASIINQSTDIAFIQSYYWEIEIPGANNFVFDTRNVDFELPDYGSYTGIMVLNPGSPCTDSLNFLINASPEIITTFTADYDTCEVGPVQFLDNSPFRPIFPITERLWQLDDGFTSADQFPNISYTAPGVKDISLLVTDQLGCNGITTGEIIWQPAPEIIIIEPGDFEVCPETNITFENSSFPVDNTYTINWDFGDNNGGVGMFTSNFYENPGYFDVAIEIISPIGCYATDTFNNMIFVDSFPISDFYWEIDDDFDILNADIHLFEQSTRTIGWDWLLPEGDPLKGPEAMYTFRDTGLQTIGLISEHLLGCYDTLFKQIDVPPFNTFHIPNALTPNGDGKNEFWKPKGMFLEQLETYEVFIFNRWGELIFQSNDPLLGWNGRGPDGSLVPSGGYSYKLSYKAPRKAANARAGIITVIY